jgi:hypothetical protein
VEVECRQSAIISKNGTHGVSTNPLSDVHFGDPEILRRRTRFCEVEMRFKRNNTINPDKNDTRNYITYFVITMRLNRKFRNQRSEKPSIFIHAIYTACNIRAILMSHVPSRKFCAESSCITTLSHVGCANLPGVGSRSGNAHCILNSTSSFNVCSS